MPEALIPPPTFRRNLYLRRGGWFTDRAPVADAGKAAVFLPKRQEHARAALLDERTTPALRDAALADPDSATPLGAAALVAAAISGGTYRHAGATADAAEPFLAARGLPFLVEAALELAAINVGGERQVGNPGWSQTYWGVRWAVRVCGGARNRLATASDEDYAAAEALAVPYRGGHPMQSQACSFLFPARQDWVEQDLARITQLPYPGLLLASLGTAAQLDLALQSLGRVEPATPALPSLIEAVGADALPALTRWYDADYIGVDDQRRLAALIAVLPTDEAFRTLRDRSAEKPMLLALQDATARFPERALRLLAPSGARAADDLLRPLVARHPELAEAALPGLPGPAAERVRTILAATGAAEAPTSHLHPVLVSPPWSVGRRSAKATVVAGLTPDLPASVAWEQERPGRTLHPSWDTARFEALAARIRAGVARWSEESFLFEDGPEHLARPLLADWDPQTVWNAHRWLPVIMARWGTEAIPAAIRVVGRSSGAAPALMPFVSVELATAMAGWYARTKSMREPARAWLLRHADAAARALIPAALGRPGIARREAETALRLLDRATVLAAAAGYGPEAAAAVTAVLDTDPLDVLPAKVPSVDWADPETLPRIALRDGSGVLPAASARHLLTMLAVSRPGEVYPGVPIVTELLDPADLAEFGWAVFHRWQVAGTPSKDGWALTALGLIGHDETVRRLAPLIRAWPGEGGHTKAVTGLDVLAAIGTDTALMHLHGIAQRVKFRALKERAGEKITEVAESLQLTPEQLADRLVPDLGLTIDSRTVSFDEQLRPYVTDPATGRRLKSLPKGAAFAALKKDARTVASDQIRRLETAMVDGRRWTGAEFHRYLAGHPLLFHLVHRLVWARYRDGTPIHTFRIAEDRTAADVHDTPIEIPDDAVIGLPHPAVTDLRAWPEIFADYEILQPFPQLGREVFTPSPSAVAAFEGLTVPTGRVLGLAARGWTRGTPQDAGWQGWIERTMHGHTVTVHLDPGIIIGLPAENPEQTISVSFPDTLDPISASEFLRDLHDLTHA
ncbi:DUF4132 domain-containing protein [Catenuloplanes japonicus]|uniref:DUF4132 domain-containing protein n=1 Tax=Catenuloplanes japonicus TaxID=33876 RepID=UPI00069142F3|nr:DUF4132 domain-containing protein [Catenuloplanes japonicus]